MLYLGTPPFALLFSQVIPKLIRADAQVLYLISTFRVLPDPCFAVMNASILYLSVRTPLSQPNSLFLFSDSPVLPCCGQGLYPTVIIVALQKTPTVTITIQRASTHFSDDPHFAPVDVRIPMSDIYSHREGTHTDSDITVLHSPSLYARNKP